MTMNSERDSLELYYHSREKLKEYTSYSPVIILLLLKGHCHAIWQLNKKLGVFVSIEFQN